MSETLASWGLTARERLKVLAEIPKFMHLGVLEVFNDGNTDWKSWLDKYVPENVSDMTIFALYAMAMSINSMDFRKINEHRENNDEAWEKYKEKNVQNKYIEEQNKIEGISFGDYSEDNICGVVATYNALQSLSNGQAMVSLPELISSYEESGIALNGAIGTAPSAINDYFINSGYETEMLADSGISSTNLEKMSEEYDSYIMLSYNSGEHISSGLHYLSITFENGGYTIHNGGDSETSYATLEKAVNGYNAGNGEPIIIIGIK